MEEKGVLNIINKDRVWNRIKKFIYIILVLIILLFILISILLFLNIVIFMKLNYSLN
jgi:hypothetical protein